MIGDVESIQRQRRDIEGGTKEKQKSRESAKNWELVGLQMLRL